MTDDEGTSGMELWGNVHFLSKDIKLTFVTAEGTEYDLTESLEISPEDMASVLDLPAWLFEEEE